MVLTGDDLLALRDAKYLLENPSFALSVMNLFGKAVEKILYDKLPAKAQNFITRISRKSLEKVLNIALFTMNNEVPKSSKGNFHLVAVTATGTIGGFLGLPGLAVELPISTTIIFRSIADIARSQGEQLSTPEAKLACLEVFALGGRSHTNDETDSSYFAIRGVLAKYVSGSIEYMAGTELVQTSGPALVRLISQLSSRFGITVSEKAVAQAAPAIGAFGGGLINVLFIDHFQKMARGHFIVRRLERKYSPEFIRNEYLKC